jgi:hypothetical protein
VQTSKFNDNRRTYPEHKHMSMSVAYSAIVSSCTCRLTESTNEPMCSTLYMIAFVCLLQVVLGSCSALCKCLRMMKARGPWLLRENFQSSSMTIDLELHIIIQKVLAHLHIHSSVNRLESFTRSLSTKPVGVGPQVKE